MNGVNCWDLIGALKHGRRKGQTKLITEALEEGLKWARNSLDNKKNIHPAYDQYVQVAEAPPLTSQELH
eukprot:5254568-Ditylum_brightwellii.AAC.1